MESTNLKNAKLETLVMDPIRFQSKTQEISKFSENSNPNVPHATPASSPLVKSSKSAQKNSKSKPNPNLAVFSPRNRIRERRFVVVKKNFRKEKKDSASVGCKCGAMANANIKKCVCVAYETLQESKSEIGESIQNAEEEDEVEVGESDEIRVSSMKVVEEARMSLPEYGKVIADWEKEDMFVRMDLLGFTGSQRFPQFPRTGHISSETESWNDNFLQEHMIRRSVKREIKHTKPCSHIFRVKLTTPRDEVYMLWEVPEEEPSQELFAENWKKQNRSGPVRDQRSHDNCSTYVGTDLFSAMRLITKIDDKFRIFSARYLTFYASPMLRYFESTDGRRKDTHHCHGNTIAATLKFIKENGVPEEDPIDAEKDFNCITDAPEQNPSILYKIGDEVEVCVSNKLKDLYEALLHQPVGANLHFFHPEFTNIGSDIYEGPLSDESCYSGLHTVLVTAVKRSKGKLVAVVKSSHGTEKGKRGYMKVSLTKMILGIGRGNEIYSPSFLLTDFTFLEIPRALNKPDEREKRKKRKKRRTDSKTHLPCLVEIGVTAEKNLVALSESGVFPDPETSVQRLLEDLASKDWIKVCESLNNTRRFAAYHPSLLQPILEKLLVVMVMVTQNPRPAVCKTWIMTCSDIFNAYGDELLEEPHLKSMDDLLLIKASQNKKFLCEEVDKALNTMVDSVARLPLLRKLQTYARHSNPRVRAKAAVSTSKCVSKMEPSEIEEFGMVVLAQMAADMLSDKFPEAREAARSMVISVYDKFIWNGEEEDEEGNKQEAWQRFCENNVTGLNAQAMIKIVSSMELRNIENNLKIIKVFKD